MDKDKYTFKGFLESTRIDNENQPLPSSIGGYMKSVVFPRVIPKTWSNEGNDDFRIYSNEGTLIATGYSGLFLHDYGIYLKVSETQIVKKNISQTTGNSTDESSANVTTYLLYKSIDGSTNLRRQIRVAGANSFDPNFYYISIFDVATGTPVPAQYGLTEGEREIICQPASCKGFYQDLSLGCAVSAGTKVQRKYAKLCEKYDELGLLGNFFVGFLDEEKTLGVANLFCTRAVGDRKPIDGLNRKSYISALTELCENAAGYRLLIPYRLGCDMSESDWDEFIFSIGCKLRGCNIRVLYAKAADDTPEAQPETADVGTELRTPTVQESVTIPDDTEEGEAADEPVSAEEPILPPSAEEPDARTNNDFTAIFENHEGAAEAKPDEDMELRRNVQRIVRTANRRTLELIQLVLDLSDRDKDALLDAAKNRMEGE